MSIDSPAPNPEALSPEATLQLLHELRVYQTELETQNEELRLSQQALHVSRESYVDFYDLAPVGYCTVNANGLIVRANLTAASLLGLARSALVKKPFLRFILKSDQDRYYKLERRRFLENGEPQSYELQMARSDGTQFWAHVAATDAEGPEGAPELRIVFFDITDSKSASAYREMGREVLQVLNQPQTPRECMQRAVAVMKAWTGFDAVGIRLEGADDYPYFAQEGFSQEFLKAEDFLVKRAADDGACRNADSTPRLECTCGLVISGRVDPASPSVTPVGSFWTNDSLQILNLPRAEDRRHRPHNRCIRDGYESVALVPIRTRDRIVGLIQFNDRRKNRFTLESVELLEGIASHVGAALVRVQAEEALSRALGDLERQVAERTAELSDSNQVLQMLSACNEALVRGTDEPALLQEVCQIIVDVGKYTMAWVGFAQDDPDRTVLPAARAGHEDGYLDSAVITWGDGPQGQGPTGTAIRTGKIGVASDLGTAPDSSPWRAAALQRGYRSSVALPLVSGGPAFGALTIYASRPAAFPDERIAFLKRLADNLASGIMARRNLSALRRVEREVLDATEREQRRIGRDLHDGIQGSLVGIGFMLEALKAGLPTGQVSVATMMAQVSNLAGIVKDTFNQTRWLARGLCPQDLKFEGFAMALSELALTTNDLFHVDCRFRNEGLVQMDDDLIAMQLYRICQEAVSNVLKHARATHITISLDSRPGSLVLQVRDDGTGIPEDAAVAEGMGLQTMAYRAALIGATLTIGRGDPGGTLVECTVPVHSPA
jgi:PAS domain S-box-containing protein